MLRFGFRPLIRTGSSYAALKKRQALIRDGVVLDPRFGGQLLKTRTRRVDFAVLVANLSVQSPDDVKCDCVVPIVWSIAPGIVKDMLSLAEKYEVVARGSPVKPVVGVQKIKFGRKFSMARFAG